MGIMEVVYCADGTPVLNVANGSAQVRFRQKQERALSYFSELNATQGYETREDAEYGARVRSRPMQQYRREKKSIIEKVISFFVEEM